MVRHRELAAIDHKPMKQQAQHRRVLNARRNRESVAHSPASHYCENSCEVAVGYLVKSSKSYVIVQRKSKLFRFRASSHTFKRPDIFELVGDDTIAALPDVFDCCPDSTNSATNLREANPGWSCASTKPRSRQLRQLLRPFLGNPKFRPIYPLHHRFSVRSVLTVDRLPAPRIHFKSEHTCQREHFLEAELECCL